MKSYRFELFKLIKAKSLVAFALIAISGLMILFAYRNKAAEVNYDGYRNLNHELAEMNTIEKLDVINNRLEELNTIETGYSAKGYYTDYIYSDIVLLTATKKEIEKTINYQEYLKEIEKVANAGMKNGPFSKTGFSLNSIKKTKQVYSRLKSVEPDYTASRGISEMLNFMPRLIMEAFISIILAVFALMKEKESGHLRLIWVQSKGRSNNLFYRFLSLYTVIMTINLIFSLIALIGACIMFGFPSSNALSSPLQSLCFFSTSPLKTSITGCLLICWFQESLICMLLATLTVFLTVLVKKTQFVYIILALFLGTEMFLYSHIDNFSKFVNLKNINLITFLNAPRLVSEYRNINIFGTAVNLFTLSLISGIIVLFLLLAASIILYAQIYNDPNVHSDKRKVSFPGFFSGTLNSFFHECYKILIAGKGMLILIAFAIVMISSYKVSGRRSLSISESFYRDYVSSLEGLSAEEVQDNIKVICQQVESRKSDLYYEERIKAIDALNDYYKYLTEKSDCVFVSAEGYERLFADKKKNSLNAIIASLLVILLISKLCVYDFEYDSDRLIKCTQQGLKKTKRNKFLISIMFTAFIFALVYIRYILSITGGYDLDMINEKAVSLMSLSKLPGILTIKLFIILIYIKFFFGLLLIYPLCRIIAAKTRNYSMTVIFTMSVIIIPLVFTYIGTPGSRYILYNLFLV